MLHGKKRRRDGLLCALIVLSAALMTSGYAENRRAENLANQVRGVYEKSIYETLELMGGLQLNLEKLMVSGSGAHEQTLLLAIVRQADGAIDNLSVLPEGQTALAGAMKFANQLGDYARVLAANLATGAALTQTDRAQLTSLHASAAALNQELRAFVEQYESGAITFDSANARRAIDRTQNEQETEPLVEYPALLYDGPFSDAASGDQLRLPGETVDAARAQETLLDMIGAERVRAIRLTGESGILSGLYEFDIETDVCTMTAGVTQTGGYILYILPDAPAQQARISQAECVDIGSRFLKRHGFGETDVSYWRDLDGILTVNYASVQDGVILYPDLIKLQISMESGLVLGMECGNYLRNHAYRVFQSPAVSEEAAREKVNPALEIARVRKCVIPIETSEAQCWELTARVPAGNRYLIYIDTQTGEERTILQIVEEADGILAQ